jgi:hypothetical protein
MAQGRYDELVEPERTRLTASVDDLRQRMVGLEGKAASRDTWLAANPDVARRLRHLGQDLADVGRVLGIEPEPVRTVAPEPLARSPLLSDIDDVLAHLPPADPRPELWWHPQVSLSDDLGIGP